MKKLLTVLFLAGCGGLPETLDDQRPVETIQQPLFTEGGGFSIAAGGDDNGINTVGSGSGAGLVAVGGSRADGIYAMSGHEDGYGLEVRTLNLRRAPVRITPIQTTPTEAQDGDMYFDGRDHRLYIFASGVWVALSPAGCR